jgi:hypothetical protein
MNASRVERRLPVVRRFVARAVFVVCAGVLLTAAAGAQLSAAERAPSAVDGRTDAIQLPTARGLSLLLTQAYLPPDFDQQVFDELWTTWEEPSRSRAEQAALPERRRMTMERYGLTPHPDDPSRSMQ